MSGCKVDEEDEAGGTKTRSERIKRVPLHTPQSQASSSPLFEQEGSAICDRFYELISERRVSIQIFLSIVNSYIKLQIILIFYLTIRTFKLCQK